MAWTDGRPVSYMKWNEIYLRNRGPKTVTTKASVFHRNIESLLLNVSTKLQPQVFEDKSRCTVLIGSPGPIEMEFISIACDMNVSVSGVLCSYWDYSIPESHHQASRSHDLSADMIYSLNHWAPVKDKPYKLTNIDNLINLENINWESFNNTRKQPLWDDSYSSLENRYHRSYLKVTTDKYTPRVTWHSVKHIFKCPLDLLDLDLDLVYQSQIRTMWPKVCHAIKNVSDYNTFKLFHLNTQVLAKTSEYHYKPQVSVQVIKKSLIVSFRCGPNWMLVHDSCLRLLPIMDGKRLIGKLQHVCRSLDMSSRVSMASSMIYGNALFQRNIHLWDL